MLTIENELLRVRVNLNGGSLTSIYDKVNDNELLYQPNGKSWNGQDVVIFPFVARLKDSKYEYNGNTYSMKNHGLIRYNELKVLNQASTSITLGYDYNEDTLKQYPYKFHFEIIYSLNENELIISYKIKNIDDKTIYYEFGGHPALKASGYETNKEFVYENTTLKFYSDIETKRYVLDDTGSYITNEEKAFLSKDIILNKEFITKDKTLIYDIKGINNVRLFTNGHIYSFDISEAEILALWTMPGFADYICVEPWWGIPDYINPNPELKDKPLMHSLKCGEEENKKYSIKIEKTNG